MNIVSTNDVSLNSLTNQEYTNVIQDMNTALHTVGYLHMNIFTDLSGLVFALDTFGNPIQSRVLVQTTYIYPYMDLSGAMIDGFMSFFFDNGASFSNYDSLNTAYTYSFDGLLPSSIKYLT